MNRRNAISVFFAGLFSPLLPRSAKADCSITIPVRADLTAFRQMARKELERAERGDSPEVQGVLGETYFKVNEKPDLSSTRKRAYFNGVDVTNLATEADAVGGWARMFDVDADGKRIITRGVLTHFGCVEFK